MIEYLIQTTDASSYYPLNPEDPPLYRAVIPAGTADGLDVLNILHTEDPTIPGDSLIGGWDASGEAVTEINEALFEVFRPLGNEPPRPIYDENGDIIGQTRGGDAPKSDLVAHGFAGWGLRRTQSLRQLGATPEEPYPADNSPFSIALRHKYFGGNADPNHDSYGWRAEFVNSQEDRDATARAIGIYRDADCTDYWYTTGAFTDQLSEWQVDENGDPLTVKATEYNPGFLGEPSQVPVDVHHAVLLGSAQEGYATLMADEDETQHQFWEKTQGETGGTWQPTGSTVTGIVGAGVYDVTDTAPFESMAVDTPLRIGGEETLFKSVFTQGAPGVITVADHNPAAVGEEIEALL